MTAASSSTFDDRRWGVAAATVGDDDDDDRRRVEVLRRELEQARATIASLRRMLTIREQQIDRLVAERERRDDERRRI